MNRGSFLQRSARLIAGMTTRSINATRKTMVLVVLAVFAFSVVVNGATYYVSPRGKNGNDGRMSYPFGSIQRAADRVNPAIPWLCATGFTRAEARTL